MLVFHTALVVRTHTHACTHTHTHACTHTHTHQNDHGGLHYLDTSTGRPVTEHRTKMGSLRCMTHNPHNGIIHLGHQNGESADEVGTIVLINYASQLRGGCDLTVLPVHIAAANVTRYVHCTGKRLHVNIHCSNVHPDYKYN